MTKIRDERLEKVKAAEKRRRRLQAPARGKNQTRIGQNMIGCSVVRAEKRMVILKRNPRPKVRDPRGSVLGAKVDWVDVPSVRATKRRIRVAEVQAPAGIRGRRGHFYNPVEAIARSIRDALDPDKVLAQTPMHCEVVQEAEGAIGGVRVAVARRVVSAETRAAYRCYLLTNGHRYWVPVDAIKGEGVGWIRVWAPWYRRKAGIVRAKPKYGKGTKVLNREAVKHQLMERRGGTPKE